MANEAQKIKPRLAVFAVSLQSAPMLARLGLIATALVLSHPAQAESLHVAAAASLTDVLPSLLAAFKATSGVDGTSTFEATSRLAKQIESGGPFDVFISADRQWADDLASKKLLGDLTTVATNRLVVVLRTGLVHPPKSLSETPSLKRIALAGENVPAGRYAQAALEHAGLWAAVKDKIVRAEHVRAALKWVELGEADAAIVYATDPAPGARLGATFPVDRALYPEVLYVAGVVATSAHQASAKRFVNFLASDAARKIFRSAGFSLP